MNGHRRRSRVLRDNREAREALPRVMDIIAGDSYATTKIDQSTTGNPSASAVPLSLRERISSTQCTDVAASSVPVTGKRPVQNSRCESVAAPDDRVPLDGEPLHRLQFFLGASKMVNQDPEFMGLVMMSLAAAVDTDTWQRCVAAAVETLEAKR